MKNIYLGDNKNFVKDLENLSDEENFNEEMDEEDNIFKSSTPHFKINNETNNQIDSSTPKILKSKIFMDSIDEIQKEICDQQNKNNPHKLSKDSRVYFLLADCNKLLSEINREISSNFISLKELYAERFPELASIILYPYEYAITVKLLGNEMNFSKTDLTYLSNNIQLTLNIMSSSTTGRPLTKEKLHIVMQLCEEIINLNKNRTVILSYIENKMNVLCPNLSALVGSSIAAKLVTAAGGIVELSKMPSSNVLVMGAQRLNLEGFSTEGKIHIGYLGELEEVLKTPEKHKRQILRRYANKCVLMARVDAYRNYNSSNDELDLNNNSDKNYQMDIENSNKEVDQNYFTNPSLLKNNDSNNSNIMNFSKEGVKLKEEIEKKMTKIQDQKQPVLKKPLARPDEKPRRKRGGKRMRSIKERYALTEIRAMKNRMKFGPEAEIEFRETGKGLGLLGVGGTGSKMKAPVKVQKINTKKQKLLAFESQSINNSSFDVNKGLSTGLHSSIAFTPVEGIELINPELLEKRYNNVKEKYFSSTSGFSTALNQKKKGSSALYEI